MIWITTAERAYFQRAVLLRNLLTIKVNKGDDAGTIDGAIEKFVEAEP